jgi:hypothetical protein
MRRGVLAAAGLAFLAAVTWNAAPAQAMAISAPVALKSDSAKLIETVHCWDCGYGGGYYRPYRPYYRPYHRPYYRSYYSGYSDYRPYYRPYRPYWGGYGYYAPRPRFYFGPTVYSY